MGKRGEEGERKEGGKVFASVKTKSSVRPWIIILISTYMPY